MFLLALFCCLVCGQSPVVVVGTGNSAACRLLSSSPASCTASPLGCWFCGGLQGGCYSQGEFNCSQLGHFFDPAVAGNRSVCSSFTCNPAPNPTGYNYWIRKESYSDVRFTEFVAATIAGVLLLLGSVVNIVFVCCNKKGFPNAEECDNWDEKPRKFRLELKISPPEIKFYVKFLEWVILLVAFTSALQLYSRPAMCSWEDKAGCLPLAPNWETVSGECRIARLSCCNGLQLGANGPESLFCECFLSAGKGPDFQCGKLEVTCYVFISFLCVMSFSVMSLLLIHWLPPFLKFAILPVYCFGINLMFFLPTFVWPTCGDGDLRFQYATNASILSVSLVVFLVMFFLMWKYDLHSGFGFTKDQSHSAQPRSNQMAPNQGIEMREHAISAPIPGSVRTPSTRAKPSSKTTPGTSLRTPLIPNDSDTTSGAISPRGLTRNSEDFL